MTSNDVFALAAHLHVLLRRKTGRVTDTEWLTTNADYAREIVRFTREKATSEEHADLLALADKLEAAIALIAAPGRKPLLQAAADTLKAGQVSAATAQRAPSAISQIQTVRIDAPVANSTEDAATRFARPYMLANM